MSSLFFWFVYFTLEDVAAVSCSRNAPRSGGVKIGFWLTGKPRHPLYIGFPEYVWYGCVKYVLKNIILATKFSYVTAFWLVWDFLFTPKNYF